MGGECSCCSSDEEKLKQETQKSNLLKKREDGNEGCDSENDDTEDDETPTKRGSFLSDPHHGFIEGSISPPLPDPMHSTDSSERKTNRFEGLTKSQCISILKELKVLKSIWVLRNEQDRWTTAHLTLKKLNVALDLHASRYIEFRDKEHGMFCILYIPETP